MPNQVGSSSAASDDLRETYEQLRSVGVEVCEPITEPWGSYIVVTDPDRYALVVSEPSQQ